MSKKTIVYGKRPHRASTPKHNRREFSTYTNAPGATHSLTTHSPTRVTEKATQNNNSTSMFVPDVVRLSASFNARLSTRIDRLQLTNKSRFNGVRAIFLSSVSLIANLLSLSNSLAMERLEMWTKSVRNCVPEIGRRTIVEGGQPRDIVVCVVRLMGWGTVGRGWMV